MSTIPTVIHIPSSQDRSSGAFLTKVMIIWVRTGPVIVKAVIIKANIPSNPKDLQ